MRTSEMLARVRGGIHCSTQTTTEKKGIGMEKVKFKKITVLISLLTLCLIVTTLLITIQYSDVLFPHPRKPKSEIPVTNSIGWWINQKELIIEAFEVRIIESRLNLFNQESLISYSVKGRIGYEGYSRPFIKEVHLSERPLQMDSIVMEEIEIQITPIIDVIKVKEQMAGSIQFELKNEHIVKSMHWGQNRIRFTCGKFTKTLVLTQSK